jgi:hypothetical protein
VQEYECRDGHCIALFFFRARKNDCGGQLGQMSSTALERKQEFYIMIILRLIFF